MKDKIKFIKELASSMNTNKIESVKYEDNNFEIEINNILSGILSLST